MAGTKKSKAKKVKKKKAATPAKKKAAKKAKKKPVAKKKAPKRAKKKAPPAKKKTPKKKPVAKSAQEGCQESAQEKGRQEDQDGHQADRPDENRLGGLRSRPQDPQDLPLPGPQGGRSRGRAAAEVQKQGARRPRRKSPDGVGTALAAAPVRG
ncbi:MAG: hypothetical protein ACYTDU_21050 [Planctomycetota bacterium]|jgi:hypothetical protein